jgi:anaerobic magnesium-protoporphyrin IX monomethyl ester cyclase
MLKLKRDHQADHIWFADDIFALSPNWTRGFADAVDAIGAAIPFKMQSRCDLMTRDTVGALRHAGCEEVWMGAESGSQKILDAMEKGTRVEQIYMARENLRRHGIRACFFLQFGYPGETLQDIERTIQMVRENAPDDIGVSVSYPLPGTKFYERVSAELGGKENWSESGDLAMMFRGAYSSEFYRELADALHLEVRGDAPDWGRVFDFAKSPAGPMNMKPVEGTAFLWPCAR